MSMVTQIVKKASNWVHDAFAHWNKDGKVILASDLLELADILKKVQEELVVGGYQLYADDAKKLQDIVVACSEMLNEVPGGNMQMSLSVAGAESKAPVQPPAAKKVETDVPVQAPSQALVAPVASGATDANGDTEGTSSLQGDVSGK